MQVFRKLVHSSHLVNYISALTYHWNSVPRLRRTDSSRDIHPIPYTHFSVPIRSTLIFRVVTLAQGSWSFGVLVVFHISRVPSVFQTPQRLRGPSSKPPATSIHRSNDFLVTTQHKHIPSMWTCSAIPNTAAIYLMTLCCITTVGNREMHLDTIIESNPSYPKSKLDLEQIEDVDRLFR